MASFEKQQKYRNYFHVITWRFMIQHMGDGKGKLQAQICDNTFNVKYNFMGK